MKSIISIVGVYGKNITGKSSVRQWCSVFEIQSTVVIHSCSAVCVKIKCGLE